MSAADSMPATLGNLRLGVGYYSAETRSSVRRRTWPARVQRDRHHARNPAHQRGYRHTH